ncbi:MAG: response regulator [Kofleriaceae bacterium]
MRILFVDNHGEFASTVTELFLRDHDVTIVPTVAAAKAHAGFDLALVDYDLDDGKGDDFVRWLRARDPGAKIIAVSARELGNEALVAAGADAVCAKTQFASIASVIARV